MAVFDDHSTVIMGASGQGGGYSVDNSIVLDDGSSQYLSHTHGTPTTAQTWTFSFWIKLCNLGFQRTVFSYPTDDDGWLYFGSDDTLMIQNSVGNNLFKTTQVFRDTHAWQHIVVSNSSGSVARLYVNGSEVTSFSLDTRAGQTWTRININGQEIQIGRRHTIPANNYADYYLSEFVFIDGQQLTPSSFGEYDINGVWRPIDISGLTFGNNGFYLPFTDSTKLGADGNYADTAYTSVNFDGTNDYLTRGGGLTGASDGEFLTFSCWFKFNGGDGSTQRFFRSDTDAYVAITKATDNKIYVSLYNSVPTQLIQFNTNNTYTADNNWHHIMVSVKRSSGDLAAHMYVDGVSDATTPSPDIAGNIDWTRSDWGIGGTEGGGNKFNGDMAEFYLTDEYIDLSQAANRLKFLTADGGPASLGSDGSTPTGTAALIYLSGATFTWHTNDGSGGGFTENGALTDGAAVRSVNANDFATSGSPTQSSDTPTHNLATLTPLTYTPNQVLSNGNRTSSSGNNDKSFGSIAFLGSQEIYFEVNIDSISGAADGYTVGICGLNTTTNNNTRSQDDYYGYRDDGQKWDSTTGPTAYGTGWATSGDVIGVYNDGAGNIIFYLNNSSQGTAYSTVDTSKMYVPFWHNEPGASGTVTAKFSSDEWTYTAPGTAIELSSTALYANAAPAIEDGTAYFQATLYTGNGTSQEINQSENSQFQPDLVWIKPRSLAYNHFLTDAIRGAGYQLQSNSTAAEADETDEFLSFDADGFTVDGNNTINTSSATHVAWQWKGDGTSGSSNTDGTIPSTVNVNDTAGFSIVTWTGAGSAGTIGHGLNSAPEFIVEFTRSNPENHHVYHASVASDAETDYLILNSAAAAADLNTIWNDTAPTSTVFSVGTANAVNTYTYVAYCFHSVPGYSAFGSYTGNVSTDGPLILLDFKPAFVMAKCISTTGNWIGIDNARDTTNPRNASFFLNLSNVEATGHTIDLLSNSFKWRASDSDVNAAQTYIYAAFAEHPFAGATPATAR